jgi:glycine reductase complex component B subunit alpha and beta
MRSAPLTMRRAHLSNVALDQRTALEDGVLSIDAASLARQALAAAGEALSDISVQLARPGESTRIVHVLDALPALARDGGPAFAGFLSPPVPTVEGTLHTFENLAILTCAELPWGAGGLLIAREAVIDMSGPLAPLSPFGSTFNLVLRIRLVPEHADVEYEAAIRRAGLAVADVLGRVAASAPPQEHTVHTLDEVDPALPRIAYI